MAKKQDPFNNPFKGLKLKKEEAPKPAPKAARPAAPPPPKAPPKPTPTRDEEEAELFLRAVGPVERVRRSKGVVSSGPPEDLAARMRSEDEEALEQLALLVGGVGSFELSDSEERVEGAITGLDRRISNRLRQGDYPVQGRIDLDPLPRAAAKKVVEEFVLEARRAGKRCVLIAQGRGLTPVEQVREMKQTVQVWLSSGRVAREVIAFASAQPQDGGTGAVYVLLRS